MKNKYTFEGLLCFGLVAILFAVGFLILMARLKVEQVDNAAKHRREMQKQSFRRVQTIGVRGRIFDRNGKVLVQNDRVVNIFITPESFRVKKKGTSVEKNILEAIKNAEGVIGRSSSISLDQIKRHLRQELARPLTVWHDVTEEELARFVEHEDQLEGFGSLVAYKRSYPHGKLASHVLGRVGRDRLPTLEGDEKINFVDVELCGRDGIELQYDELLRGMPGEDRLYVDARGFSAGRTVVKTPNNGFDLNLTLDLELQRAAEKVLEGERGAFVAIDPRDGSVRAMASAPSFDPRECVPVFPQKVYERYANDPGKPLLNRAVAGTYAPGSTFKPLTALAAMHSGILLDSTIDCVGYYHEAGMKIRCTRTWGHGVIGISEALRVSCNPFFSYLGVEAGTNSIYSICNSFGLGKRTGIDFPKEESGLVPTADDKARLDGSVRWYSGDVAQMSIGQGMLLVTPLQMSLVAAALGTGKLPTPHLSVDYSVAPKDLKIPAAHLEVVQQGMRMVVENGTGRKAGEGVDATIIGKTGTAEIGPRDNRRKNTWFIGYSQPTQTSLIKEPLAFAIVIENGDTGGSTAAPKVATILKSFYGKGGE